MKKQELKHGVSPINTVLLTSMSLLVSAGPALANGGQGSRFVPGLGGDNRAANRAERAQRHADRVADRLSRQEDRLRGPEHLHRLGLNPINDRVADRIADRINARQARVDQLTINSQPRVKAQTLAINSNALGEPSLTRRGIELDLSSDRQSVVLGSRLFGKTESVTIKVGGVDKTFSAGMSATAGEYVAIQEVLGGSQQSISLTSSGVANGGNFSLNDAVSKKVSTLVIPEQVSAVGEFARKTFEINGDLVNHGTIYGYSTRSNRGEISIVADDIHNSTSGKISTVLPGSMLGVDVESKTNLALTAENDINNAGAITSSGSLSLTSLNGKINNASGAVMSADGSVTIAAGSGNINNAGLISSATSDVNINAPDGIGLNLNGLGGAIQATLGNINIRDCDITGDVTMTGGDYFSNNLNIRTGSGALEGTVGKVTGLLNTSGYAAHFAADTENLLMGDNFQDGDPTFANTGNITISGNVTANEDLTILAGGNITAGGAFTISTRNSIIPEGGIYKPSTNITIIAGANVSTTGTTTTNLPGAPIGSGTATVDFSAGGGGNVSLSGVTINTSSNLAQNPSDLRDFYQENAGNVTIVAYANGATGGTVNVGNIIATSVNGVGGDVSIYAGANPGSPTNTITVGNISTAGGGSVATLGSGGNIEIIAAQAGLTSGTTLTFNPDGSVAGGGSIIPVGPVSSNANIQIGNVTTGSGADGSTNINSHFAGNVLIKGGAFSLTSGASINTGARFVGGSVQIDAAGALTTTGGDIRTGTIGNSLQFGMNGGRVTLNGTTVSVDEIVTGNSTTRNAGSVSIRATTGNITTGQVFATGTESQQAVDDGNVLMDAVGSIVINTAATNAIAGNNIALGGTAGVSVTSAGGAGSTSILSGGSVLLTAGNSANSATINVSGGISTEDGRPGFIQIVNNAQTTGSVNVTVGGLLDADALSVNGAAGSVSVVSSGAISLQNISATSINGTFAPQSSGGGIFISSGATGANAITVGNINVSAKAFGGTILLLSSTATTGLNPNNISRGTFTLDGGIAGQSFVAGLNGASSTIPTELNVTLTIGGPEAINIRPGGYQTAQGTVGSPVDVQLNISDSRLLVPINVGAVGNSLFLGEITAKNDRESINIITSGTLNVMEDLVTSGNTRQVLIQSKGGFVSTGSDISLGTTQGVFLSSAQQGFTVDSFRGSAGDLDVVINGSIDAANAAGNGSLVAFSSTLGGIFTNDIRTFGTGVGATAGGVTLTGLYGVETGNINASSYLNSTQFNGTGAGDIFLTSNDYVSTGDLTNAGNGRIKLNADSDPTDVGGSILTGNIYSPYTVSAPEITVSLSTSGWGAVVTKDITTASATGSSGGIAIATGDPGVSIRDINTSSAGLNAGSVSILSRGDVRVASINATTSGTTQNGRGGNVEINASGRGISWGFGDINTSASYSGISSGDGGNVILNASHITGFDIITSSSSLGNGDGGSVTINAGQTLLIKDVITSAAAVGATAGRGGDVIIAGGTLSAVGINTRLINTQGITRGGDVSGYGSSAIVAENIDTRSTYRGGDVRLYATSFVVAIEDINTSATNTGVGNAEGGSVAIASRANIVFVGNDIITSATATNGDATGGSVGLVGHTNGNPFVVVVGGLIPANGIINTSANGGPGSAAVAGAIYAASSQGSAGALQLGTLNTEAVNGLTNNPGPIFLGARNGNAGSIVFTLAGSNTPAAETFFAAAPITGSSHTISVKPGNITIQPGVYDTIGTSTTPVSLTLDFGGDSRLLIPLITNGALGGGTGIFVSGVNANNATAGGALPFQNNGYDVHLIGFGTGFPPGQAGNRISGNITSAPVVGGAQGDIEIVTFVGIDQTGGVISGNSLTLTNLGSSNISAANPIVTDVPTMTARLFNVGTVQAARNLYVQNVRNGVADLVGFNGTTGFNGSIFSITGGASTSFSLDSQAVIVGSTIELLTAGTSNSISLNGNISGNTFVSTTELRAATVSLGGAASVRTAKVLVETAALANAGLIEAIDGAVAIDNSTVGFPATLSITGSGKLSATTAVTLSTTGNIDFGGLIQGGVLTLARGQVLAMVAGGNITATGSNTNFSITSGGTAGDAGSLMLIAGSVYTIGASTFNDVVLPVGPMASATGGSVILDGSNGGYIANVIDLRSDSGAGGSLNIVAQGPAVANNNILLPVGGTIQTGGLSSNGTVLMYAAGPASGTGNAITAGSIDVGGNLAIGGIIDIEVVTANNEFPITVDRPFSSFNLPNVEDGLHGSVTIGDLRSRKGYIYAYAADNLNVNFANNTLDAVILELSAANGSLALPVNEITMSTLPGGHGGIMFIGGQTVTWLNQGTTALTLNADADLNTFGAGGRVDFEIFGNSALGIGNGANSVNISAVSRFIGGDAVVATGGNLSVNSDFLNVGIVGTDGNGGSIQLYANTVTNSNVGQAIVLDVSGKGNGSGGTVLVDQSAIVDAIVGPGSGPNVFRLSANSGTTAGDAGNIFMRTGGNLTVDTSGIQNNVLGSFGSGGILELVAGRLTGDGVLQVSGTINVDGKGGGAGGVIFLSSNSAIPMSVGGKSTPANGIAGFPSAKGSVNGTLTVTNFGGDVTIGSTPKDGFRRITLQAGGTGDVVMPSKFGSSSLDLVLRALGTGDVTGSSGKSTITADSLVLSSMGGDVIGFSGAPLVVSANKVQAVGTNVNISAKKNLTLDNGSGATNSFTAQAANIFGNFTVIAPTVVLTAKSLVAQNSNGTSPLTIQANNLTIDAGTGIIRNQGGGTLTVSSTSSKTKNLSIDSVGNIEVITAIGGKKTTLLLDSDGNINTSGTGLIGAGNFTAIAQGSIGNLSTLQISAATISANAQGSISINDVAASVLLNDLSAGNGDITVTTGTSTKSLSTRAAKGSVLGANIFANNGAITLQNNNTTKGSIVVGAGSKIITDGVGGGDVSILIGGTTAVAGPTPVGVEFTQDGVPITNLPAGTFFFGTNGIAVSGTSVTDPTIQMNVIGGKSVIFNTGTLAAKAITVQGGTSANKTVITADPPITASVATAALAGDSANAASQLVAPSSFSDTTKSTGSLPAETVPQISSADTYTTLDRSAMGSFANAGGFSTLAQQPSASAFDVSASTQLVAPDLVLTGSASLNLIPTNSAALATDLSDYGQAGTTLSTNLSPDLSSNLPPLSASSPVTSALAPSQAQDGWLSETELSSGHVPGVVCSDADMAIHSDVSTVVDITKSGAAHGGAHQLNKGAVLFAPTVDTTVDTPHGKIRIDANSVVFVLSFKDGVAVFDIDDTHKNAVAVSTGEREVSLAPGCHVMLTRDNVRTMGDINPAQLIGHRNVKEHALDAGLKMFSSEFSIPHAIGAVLPVKQLMTAKHSHSKQLANHLMKTVAIHMHLNQNADNYKQLLRPSTTAYAK